MDFKDLESKISDISPFLGSAISSSIKNVEEVVIGLIATTLGVKEDPQEILKAIETNSEAICKIQEIEKNHKEEIMKLIIEEQQSYINNFQSARDREMDIVSRLGKPDVNLYVLAWVIVVGFYSLTGMLIFTPLPKDSNGVIFTLFGGVVSAFSTVIAYFFGSSLGSFRKDAFFGNTNNKK